MTKYHQGYMQIQAEEYAKQMEEERKQTKGGQRVTIAGVIALALLILALLATGLQTPL